MATQDNLSKSELSPEPGTQASFLAVIGYILIFILCCSSVSASDFQASSRAPSAQPNWQDKQTKPEFGAPGDEPHSGKTAAGTPVHKRTTECFPAEPRNIFYQVGRVASGPHGALELINFDLNRDGQISGKERDAVRGLNTWILWTEGNEAFWNWDTQYGYGLTDFLVMLDSRKRDTRFKEKGLINQPGLSKRAEKNQKILGLYIDESAGDEALMKQPKDDFVDIKKQLLAAIPKAPKGHPTEWFTPGDRNLYEKTIQALPKDGVDPSIYGYPSGVLGMRLFPNPDFFGDTDKAAAARRYWDERVVKTNDAYYTDSEINADPNLVRPFRTGMACAYCHIAPHPLAPPADPEHPKWENLSAVAGNQYWEPKECVANLLQPSNFLYHFLISQQPGTVDTAMVPSDHINNPNNINTIVKVPERIKLALKNPPESQSDANELLPGIEEGVGHANPRHVPRVLKDGADSIGILGATSRVYLNIGTFYEEWNRCHNPILGVIPQRPFPVATLNANSVFWRTAEKYRINFLDTFFTYTNPGATASGAVDEPVPNSPTSPTKLIHTPEGRAYFSSPEVQAQAAAGKQLFLQNCAVCHSSRQPDDITLAFDRNWRSAIQSVQTSVVASTSGPTAASHSPEANASPPSSLSNQLTLPMDFAEWDEFTKSQPYRSYVQKLQKVVASDPQFWQENLLSNDTRIPVTLVGTNSSRAVATNAMAGQIWDNFSSSAYKNLPAVGGVRFYNPYSDKPVDEYGRNDVYFPPAGGPGYYRPASLAAAWATAPFFNNNTLGLFNHDPSVAGRVAAFDDAIKRLFWKKNRIAKTEPLRGDLRAQYPQLAGRDPGFIYRTPEVTYVQLSGRFIKQIISGVVGPFLTDFVSTYVWILLALVLAFLTWRDYRAAVVALYGSVSVGSIIFLLISHFDKITPTLWLLPLLTGAVALFFMLRSSGHIATRVAMSALLVATILLGIVVNQFIAGAFGGIKFGPIPKGTPVNLIMNLNPGAPVPDLADAVLSLGRACGMLATRNLDEVGALRLFESEAGVPLIRASKCPDFVQDEGHYFGDNLSDEEKEQLAVFLKTL